MTKQSVSRDSLNGLERLIDEFLFADDMTKGAQTEEKMQKGVDQVSDSCNSYDLTISIKKNEVVYQPAPGKPYKEPTITVNGQRLHVVDKFTYLRSTLSRVVHIEDEAMPGLPKLADYVVVLGRCGIRLDTKLKVYKVVVLPTLLYACEMWKSTSGTPKDWTTSIQAALENF